MQDTPKAVWSIPYISVVFFPSLKHNFIAYRSSKVSDCIFEIHQLWQSGFSRVYSNCCCSCSFEAEIINIGQSSHKMYNNNIVNFQESATISNAYTKKSGNLLKAPCILETNHYTWADMVWFICLTTYQVLMWHLRNWSPTTGCSFVSYQDTSLWGSLNSLQKNTVDIF